MITTDRPTLSTNRASEDSFAWDNSRYDSVIEQHTGMATSMLDRGICFGLMAFGMLSLMGTIAMTLMHVSKLLLGLR